MDNRLSVHTGCDTGSLTPRTVHIRTVVLGNSKAISLSRHKDCVKRILTGA